MRMNRISSRLNFYFLTGSLAVALWTFFFAPTRASEQEPPSPQPQATTQTPNTEDTAAARAAERKRRFDEQRRKLENSGPSSPIGAGPELGADQTLFVSPATVNLLVGEFRELCVFDVDGKVLTSSAEWSITDSSVAALTTDGVPTISTKQPGKTLLRARVGNRTSEASITVIEGRSLPVGSIKWAAPQYPGYKNKQIMQAVPTAHGPDMYTMEEDDQGHGLIRAWTSEGLFLWLRKLDHGTAGIVPH